MKLVRAFPSRQNSVSSLSAAVSLQPSHPPDLPVAKRNSAPPVYRPQSPPSNSMRPKPLHGSGAAQAGNAPPVYRPAEVAGLRHPTLAGRLGQHTPNGAPPVWLPSNPVQPRLLADPRASRPGAAPPVYRPQPHSPAVITKAALPWAARTLTAVGVSKLGRPAMPPPGARTTIQNGNGAEHQARLNNHLSSAPALTSQRGEQTIQASCDCFSGCFSGFLNLFKPRPRPSPAYVELRQLGFDSDYGVDQIRQQIELQQTKDKESGWFTDDTCSNTARRVSKSFGVGSPIGRNKGYSSLEAFMNGKARTAPRGVVIHVKLQWITENSQHEFAILQKGDECFLVQSWVGNISLGDWFSSSSGLRKRSVAALLRELQEVESAMQKKDESIASALDKTFGARKIVLLNWTGIKMEMAWEAWNQV